MLKRLLVCVLLLSSSPAVQGQHIITTVAGGGPPNNTSALQVSIGEPASVYKDSAGNLYIASETLNAIFKVDGNGRLTTVAQGRFRQSIGRHLYFRFCQQSH